MKRLPIAKFISVNIIAWAIVLTCHAACQNYAGLIALRFLLGLWVYLFSTCNADFSFEATITPVFVLIISMWYRRNEQAGRMSMWLAANGLANIICSPIAYGLSGITNPVLASWRVLYLVVSLSRHNTQS